MELWIVSEEDGETYMEDIRVNTIKDAIKYIEDNFNKYNIISISINNVEESNYIERPDGRIERVCECGVAHTIIVPETHKDDEFCWRHGCCEKRCCQKWKKEE